MLRFSFRSPAGIWNRAQRGDPPPQSRQLVMQRLGEREHVGFAGVVDGHPRTGQESRDRGDVEDAAAVAGQAVDESERSSVSARTLRSSMASCSLRSSRIACPTSPKPALLTTFAGSRSRAVSSAARSERAPDRSRSTFTTIGQGRPSSASSTSRCCHQGELMCVLGENPRQSAPMPEEAPVIA